MTVKVDGYTRFMLTVISVLLTVVAAGLWFESSSAVSPAAAKIPDSGMQLQQVIEKMDDITGSMKDMRSLLASGKVKVQVVEAEPVKKPLPVTKTKSAPVNK